MSATLTTVLGRHHSSPARCTMLEAAARMEGCPLVRTKIRDDDEEPSRRRRRTKIRDVEEMKEAVGLGLSGSKLAVGFMDHKVLPCCDAAVACTLDAGLVRGKRILQICFGTSLSAVAASHAGAAEAVVVTKDLALAQRSFAASRASSCSACQSFSGSFDLCLALDVFHGSCDEIDLVRTLREALRPSSFAVVAFTKHNEPREVRLVDALTKNFDITILHLPSTDRLKFLDPKAANTGLVIPLHGASSPHPTVVFRVERRGACSSRLSPSRALSA